MADRKKKSEQEKGAHAEEAQESDAMDLDEDPLQASRSKRAKRRREKKEEAAGREAKRPRVHVEKELSAASEIEELAPSASSSWARKPAVEWTVAEVIDWAKAKVGVSDRAAKVLEDQEINGAALLKMTEETLIGCGMALGPATNIMAAVHDQLAEVSDVFAWRAPHPLLETWGLQWPFQHEANLLSQMAPPGAVGVAEHFIAWREGKVDKSLHPVYLCAAGPGEGKSPSLASPHCYNFCAAHGCPRYNYRVAWGFPNFGLGDSERV